MANKFKIGDHVRIMRRYGLVPYKVGDIGMVCAINPSGTAYYLKFDNIIHGRQEWWALEPRIQLVNFLMKCE